MFEASGRAFGRFRFLLRDYPADTLHETVANFHNTEDRFAKLLAALEATMPGLSIYDFGDSIRFGANHSREDEKDLSKVTFDLELYEVFTRGFLEGAQGSLTPRSFSICPGARGLCPWNAASAS